MNFEKDTDEKRRFPIVVVVVGVDPGSVESAFDGRARRSFLGCQSEPATADGASLGSVRDPAFRLLPRKIQEELSGTQFATLSAIYDEVGVEDMRAEMKRADQAVSGLS